MKKKIDRRKSNLQVALNKLQQRINRGEVDNPEERIEQIKRAFGGEGDNDQTDQNKRQ